MGQVRFPATDVWFELPQLLLARAPLHRRAHLPWREGQPQCPCPAMSTRSHVFLRPAHRRVCSPLLYRGMHCWLAGSMRSERFQRVLFVLTALRRVSDGLRPTGVCCTCW
jgi:hypothetical protein